MNSSLGPCYCLMEFFGVYNLLLSWEKKCKIHISIRSYLNYWLFCIRPVKYPSKELERVQDEETKRAVKGEKGGKDTIIRHGSFYGQYLQSRGLSYDMLWPALWRMCSLEQNTTDESIKKHIVLLTSRIMCTKISSKKKEKKKKYCLTLWELGKKHIKHRNALLTILLTTFCNTEFYKAKYKFKCLGSVRFFLKMFLKEVSYAHKGCLQKYSKTVISWNIITI